MVLISQTACHKMRMIIVVSVYNLSNWQIPFGKEAVGWYFLNSCVALMKTNYCLCYILESCVLFSTVSEITSLNFEHTVICCIFRLWLTVLLIFSPLLVLHKDGSYALPIIRWAALGIMALHFCGEKAENTCASPASIPLQAEGVFMCA